jgi:hypothetical protein
LLGWIDVESDVDRDFPHKEKLNYLKAAGGGVGMLLNFGREPTHKRFVMGDASDGLPGLRAQL